MAIYIDQHVHSNVSHDGKSTYQEYMEYAKEHGVEEITFTEHFDDYKGVNSELKTLDIDYYREQYQKAKDDAFVKTNFGIEIGLRPKSFGFIHDMVEKNQFDFIIGSSHITKDIDIAKDNAFFRDATPQQAINAYLSEVFVNAQMYRTEFDVYGHLDYIIRYIINYYGNVMSKVDYNDFRDLINWILTQLIMDGKGIEVNTSGLKYGLGTTHPNIDIIKRYKELGGKIITMGSDAHKTAELAGYFNDVYDMLESIGYDEIAVFHNRVPDFVKIRSLRK